MVPGVVPVGVEGTLMISSCYGPFSVSPVPVPSDGGTTGAGSTPVESYEK
jgi:hypothetical protein